MRPVRFFFSIMVFGAIIFLVSFLLPSKVTLSKSILIRASQMRVNREIQDFSNWKNWYPAFQNEKVSVIKNSTKPGVINSVSITDEKGKRLDLDLIKSKPDTIVIDLVSNSSTKVNYQFILSTNRDGQTQITWNVNASSRWYPWEKIKGIFLDKISGPQYEAALIDLKKASEK